jgi:hypothetical protein
VQQCLCDWAVRRAAACIIIPDLAELQARHAPYSAMFCRIMDAKSANGRYFAANLCAEDCDHYRIGNFSFRDPH